MRLRDRRCGKEDAYTIGEMFVDDVYFCDTLEDKDRGLKQGDDLSVILGKKVPGETAIPAGTYSIAMDVLSPKYSADPWYMELCGGMVPRLLDVPGFDGVLIHVGNTALHSAGCILVGKNTDKGRLTESKATFAELYRRMKAAHDRGEVITITIE